MIWSFAGIWNQSLDDKAERPLIKRDRIWATELGGAYVDRWLKMNAVKPSNPPNPRSMRKFEAGNIWESIIAFVLTRAGILQDSQEYIKVQLPGMLEVSGKLDFTAGGKPDYDKAKALISKEFEWLPEFVLRATWNIVDNLSKQYPNGLESIILECKSSSSFMFDNYEARMKADPKHELQLFHYLFGKKMPEGHVVYVCKDDARLCEIPIRNPSYLEDVYKADIKAMTECFKSPERPPNEPLIVWKDNFLKFAVNWKVEYSNYLTMLYGYKTPAEFNDSVSPTVERWNRVLGRIKDEKPLTDNNKEALSEITQSGFDIEVIKKQIEESKKPKEAK